MSTLRQYLPAGSRRVERNTNPSINQRNQLRMQERIAGLAGASPAAIAARMEELDREWDVERVLETNAAFVILASVLLGFTVDLRWFGLTGLAGIFLLQHALQGWCPPLALWRRMGIRTCEEIGEERMALLQLRGDLQEGSE